MTFAFFSRVVTDYFAVCLVAKSCPTLCDPMDYITGFPSGSEVKKPPAMQEVQVWSLGQADPLAEGMASHSSILAWKIPWTEEPGRLQSIELQTVRHDWSD